ncbi:hypothetical protein [Streptosporangium sp. NBC_01756]|uniref:hypothetical protein n=1 Tax=Streptosporangium sp. NBC_01756 TaxID=2975950 RepID=UPI002DDB6C89|nr:hypothetical protein [Streptosporangium sp. NBC_01756]WSC89885.1 hypothetical protein OIE48_17380 [Streptosporangium sp. NBC_01756]
MRSYTSSTGVSRLRQPGGEGVADHPSSGSIIATAEHVTEPRAATPRSLSRPKARVSTLKEM